jgi:insulysin
LRLGFK